MGVKCKDCLLMQLLEFKITEVKTTNPNQPEPVNLIILGAGSRMIRIVYCPVVDLVVDMSTERECGCFNRKEE